MTKKYKVGDTIYVKGKVKQVDEDDEYPYSMVFNDSNYTDASDVWISDQSIVEPSKEQAQVTLPKDIADEMSFAKSIEGATFDDYIVRELIRSDYKYSATKRMIQSLDVPNAIEVLLNAWNNGYTIEKPKLYNLILSEDYYKGAVVCLYKPIQSYELNTISSINDDDFKHNKKYQFTQEEIDECNKSFWIKNIDLNDYKVEVPTDEE